MLCSVFSFEPKHLFPTASLADLMWLSITQLTRDCSRHARLVRNCKVFLWMLLFALSGGDRFLRRPSSGLIEPPVFAASSFQLHVLRNSSFQPPIFGFCSFQLPGLQTSSFQPPASSFQLSVFLASSSSFEFPVSSSYFPLT